MVYDHFHSYEQTFSKSYLIMDLQADKVSYTTKGSFTNDIIDLGGGGF